jgi:predicted short-subunit dehydrogenase-like oxidoreductase (DUF2520 family)
MRNATLVYTAKQMRPAEARAKPAIALVGAGRLGRVLGRALARRGWKVRAVVTRSERSARAAARAIGRGRAYGRFVPELGQAGLVVIATPDQAIGPVAARLARLGSWRGKIVLHTSGALAASVLAPLARRGAAIGSFHPLQTFGRRGAPELSGVTFAIEGDARACRVAARLARDLGGRAVSIDPASKAAYHAAGVFAAPHLLAVIEAAARILMAAGFRWRRAVEALLPLARETLRNWEQLGPRAAWTGPIARADLAVVASHLRALRRLPREYAAAYAALARLEARTLARRPETLLRRLGPLVARSGPKRVR